MKTKYLTEREYEIMKILWSSEKPMLISDIMKLTKITAKNSIHPLLKNLIKNGYVKVVGNVIVVKTFSRLYAPAISLEDYTAMQVNEIFKKQKRNFDLKRFLVGLSKENKANNQELVEYMRTFIDNCEKKAKEMEEQ